MQYAYQPQSLSSPALGMPSQASTGVPTRMRGGSGADYTANPTSSIRGSSPGAGSARFGLGAQQQQSHTPGVAYRSVGQGYPQQGQLSAVSQLGMPQGTSAMVPTQLAQFGSQPSSLSQPMQSMMGSQRMTIAQPPSGAWDQQGSAAPIRQRAATGQPTPGVNMPSPVNSMASPQASGSRLGNNGPHGLPTRFMGGVMRPATALTVPPQSIQQGSSPTRVYHFARPKSASKDAVPKNLGARPRADTEREEAQVRDIYKKMDWRGNGTVSKFELVSAMAHDQSVCDFLQPGCNMRMIFEDEATLQSILAILDYVFGSKQKIKYSDFAARFRPDEVEHSESVDEVRAIFDLIDTNQNGSISKLEFVAAVQRNSKVSEFVLPGIDSSEIMTDEWSFDVVDATFEAISGGKKAVHFEEFSKHFRKQDEQEAHGRARTRTDRAQNKIFIIGPGFGMKLNPKQCEIIENADYELYYCIDVPNPEQHDFNVSAYLGRIKEQIDTFQPDILACASKGGLYAVGLWQMGYWRGPTLLINAHPSCKNLPTGIPVVLCHGSNDDMYPTSRAELERLISTGTPNKCFLYYTANSGQLPSGQFARLGDKHDMESLINHDCLPRLIDACLCPDGPSVYMLRTWRERLTEERLDAERDLGYTPDDLFQISKAKSDGARKRPSITKGINVLFDVMPDSDEFKAVSEVFKSVPKEPPAYMLPPAETWKRTQIVRIERVKNKLQLSGSTKPYFTNVEDSLEEQGIDYEPGMHTVWAFHGASAEAIESIITNPVAGFQPLASGTRGSTLWGSGVYFGRDAQYVAMGGSFCAPREDGTKQMLMCLLMVGMPTLGDPGQHGVLPFRSKPHRYNSTNDSMSSPEIYIMQHSGGAYPAYLITFKEAARAGTM